MTEGWMLLKDGAAEMAQRRLGDMNQLLASTVAQFHVDAAGQVEGLYGPSYDGMGASMFNAVTTVIGSMVPASVVSTVGMTAIRSFRDVLVAGVNQAASSSASGRLAAAKEELRRVLGDLTAATRDSANAAWSEGAGKVRDSLNELFEHRSELRNLEYDYNATSTEEWLCDQIGIQDAHVANPSHLLIQQLWQAFHHDYYLASSRVRWADRNHYEKLQFLAELAEDERAPFLSLMGEDVAWWTIALRQWITGNTGGPSMHQ